MAIIDIIILTGLGIGLVSGIIKGLVKQTCAVVGLVAGLLVARALYGAMGEQLASHIGTSVTVAQIISFIMIWAVVPLLVMLAGNALTKALEAVHLGMVNRLLGGVAGALLYLLLMGILLKVVEFVDADSILITNGMKQDSVFYHPVKEVAGIFFPAIKEVTEQIIK